MASRQERRKATREAAKRAPAQAAAAGAVGAAAAAAAVANINLNPRDPGGDWTTQAEDPAVGGLCSPHHSTHFEPGLLTTTASSDVASNIRRPFPEAVFLALGSDTVKRKAAGGDREAQWSQGFMLLYEAEKGAGTMMGTAGRTPMANVGYQYARCPAQFPVAHQTGKCRGGHRSSLFLRVPTLSGGGHWASGEGGRARARVRYERMTLSTGRVTLSSGRVNLSSGRVTLSSERVTLSSGRVTL
jgi:hypothetical protein